MSQSSNFGEHKDSFVIIGGLGVIGGGVLASYSDKIYRYDTSVGGWTEVQTTLSEGKSDVTAMKVKSSAFDSCNSIG